MAIIGGEEATVGSSTASGALAGSAFGPWGTAAGAGVGLLGGLATVYMGRDAKSDAKKAQDKYQAMLNDIANAIENNYEIPTVDDYKFTPEEYQALAIYKPSIAQEITEKYPQIVTEAASVTEKAAQSEALKGFQDISRAGYDPTLAAQQARSTAEVDQANRQRMQEVLKSYSQRGLGGSSTELAAGLQTAQDSGKNAYLANMQAQSDAQQRKIAALGQYGSLAGQIRGQNTATESANANIINQFNERMTKNKQDYLKYKANEENEMKSQDWQNRQNIASQNVGARNTATMFNVNRNDTQEQNRINALNAKLLASNNARMGAGTAAAQNTQADINRNLGMGTAAMQGVTDVAKAGANYYAGADARQADIDLKKAQAEALRAKAANPKYSDYTVNPKEEIQYA